MMTHIDEPDSAHVFYIHDRPHFAKRAVAAKTFRKHPRINLILLVKHCSDNNTYEIIWYAYLSNHETIAHSNDIVQFVRFVLSRFYLHLIMLRRVFSQRRKLYMFATVAQVSLCKRLRSTVEQWVFAYVGISCQFAAAALSVFIFFTIRAVVTCSIGYVSYNLF